MSSDEIRAILRTALHQLVSARVAVELDLGAAVETGWAEQLDTTLNRLDPADLRRAVVLLLDPYAQPLARQLREEALRPSDHAIWQASR